MKNRSRIEQRILTACSMILLMAAGAASATPANLKAAQRYYDRFLPKKLANCSLCHLPLLPGKSPDSLLKFPHNGFGNRLRLAGEELRKSHLADTISARLTKIASEDSDGDGFDNLSEILLGTYPGNSVEKPSPSQLKTLLIKRAEFNLFLASYRWQPFESVHRPAVPSVKNMAWCRNPIDAFIAAEQEARHLKPRPAAPKYILLRRIYLDLIGLSPIPAEISAFENDNSPNAYEKVVDRLLASPQYGERWGRHWMDVWRYSDWAGWNDGGQIRDSKPHIWRWRDWIVESLNKDKGYDRMATEMLAADELCPEDTDALRATGFLVRNYKLLSREQWLEDTLNHTSKAFLGVTLHCAKCHNHMYDPITQEDYYRVRAVFEPHNVRTDRIPGHADITKDGLVHAYDADLKALTYLFIRGDERNPDKSKVIEPGIPAAFGGSLDIKPVALPRSFSQPDRREFVIKETIAASESAWKEAKKSDKSAEYDTKITPEQLGELKRLTKALLASHEALLAILDVEKLEEDGKKSTDEWKLAALKAAVAQRSQTLREAELAQFIASNAYFATKAKPEPTIVEARNKYLADIQALKTKADEAMKVVALAEKATKAPLSREYRPRILTAYPTESGGRRLAFARWLTDSKNPLTARVAVNHIWARHFGEGLVPSMEDFGGNGRKPSHPKLLDWLAAEFMANRWSMKSIHRLIITSSAYRMDSRPDNANLQIDPDDVFLWRMPSKRMEAEIVRDNVLNSAGQLDLTRGGPEIDQNLGLVSKRRSIYLRTAAEKQAEFMQVFDGPSVTECYARRPTVMPQQALALANSQLTLNESRILARELSKTKDKDDSRFTVSAFLRVLARRPTAAELKLCMDFLHTQSTRFARAPQAKAVVQVKTTATNTPDIETASLDPKQHARENLVLTLFNHNDFVTIR